MSSDAQLQDGIEYKHDLGVLFVHGIGEQRQNSTLARFGGSLERWLGRSLDPVSRPPEEPATEDRIAAPPAVEVEAVERHTGNGDDPAYARLLVGRPGEPVPARQRWLLAEGWWAAEVSPPTFKAFVRWVLPMLPWLAAEYFVAAARRPQSQHGDPSPSVHTRPPNRFEKLIESLSLAGLLWLLSPVVAVLAMLACLVLAVLQRIPVIGKRVNAATANLVAGVGDAYLFAFDGLARAAMMQRIRRNLDWLRADERRCRKVVIVAHSQGAALCHDLLRSGALRPQDPIHLLVTVGSGVRRLNGFRQLHYDATLRSLGWTSIAGLLALVTGMVLVLRGLGSAGSAGLWAWLGGLAIITGTLIAGPTWSRWQRYGRVLAALGAVVLVGAGLVLQSRAGALLVAGAILMSLGVWLYRKAFRQALAQVDQVPRLALPDGVVGRWLDFYSTADPVPNGPLRTWPAGEQQPTPPPAVHPTARCVYNLRSIQADHSYYFDNTEEFVSELALELAAESGLPGQPLTESDRLVRARARRRWRTSCRSNARNLLLATGLLGGVAITVRLGGGRGWAGLGADAGVTAQPPYGILGQVARWVQDWLGRLPIIGGLADQVTLPSFAGMLLATALVVAAALLLGRLWSLWDTNDIDRFFLGTEALGTWRRVWPPWAFLGLTGLLVVGTMTAVATYAGRSWLVLALLAGSLLLTATLVWVRWKTCLDEDVGHEPAIGPHAQLDEVGAQ
jgi:hypothetical protein